MSATVECVGGPWDGDSIIFPSLSPDAVVWVPFADPWEVDRMGAYRPDCNRWLCFWYPEPTKTT